jgi:hypothetical protein
MKAYCGSGGIDPRILDLGTRWRWVVNFTPRPLYPKGKSPWYPSDRRLGKPHSRSGRGGEEKISSPCRVSNPRSSNRRARTQSPYQLSYPGSTIIIIIIMTFIICTTHRRDEKCKQNSSQKTWKEEILWEILKKRCENVDWIFLPQDRDQWPPLVITIWNFGFHKRRGIPWLSELTISFSITTFRGGS